ncbi:MAG TPA: tetratricopeptide repeat protein [Candidatus Krumholzibacteria bacterium]|nr:tetratricopeptide repeat protein [Candidatus Krumholzibacteria bacterium]
MMPARAHLASAACAALLLVGAAGPVRAAGSPSSPPVEEAVADSTVADPYDTANLPRKLRKVVFLSSAYARRGEYEKAADVLLRHLADHPDQDHYLLRLHLAQHLSDLGRTAEALDQYRHAIELKPALDRGWMGLGDAAYDLERYEVAGEAFLAGYECSRERRPEVLYYAAASYLMAGEPARALPLFEQLTAPGRGRRDLEWYQGLVIAASGAGEPERADDAVRRLVEALPDDPEAWFLRYQQAVGRRDFRAAAISLTVVGYLRDLTAAERRQLGDLYSVSEVPWLASREYAAAVDSLGRDADAADWERLVSSLVAAHDTGEALQALDGALARSRTPRLVGLQGDIHYLRHEYEDALDAYAALAALGDDTGRAWLMQGYCALELGRRDQALDLLARASNFAEQAEMAQLLMQRALKLDG